MCPHPALDYTTKAAAQRWLDQVTAGLVRGDYADPKVGRVTVGEYSERWFSSTTTLSRRHATATGASWMSTSHTNWTSRPLDEVVDALIGISLTS